MVLSDNDPGPLKIFYNSKKKRPIVVVCRVEKRKRKKELVVCEYLHKVVASQDIFFFDMSLKHCTSNAEF